jgi:hypothetical protein
MYSAIHYRSIHNVRRLASSGPSSSRLADSSTNHPTTTSPSSWRLRHDPGPRRPLATIPSTGRIQKRRYPSARASRTLRITRLNIVDELDCAKAHERERRRRAAYNTLWYKCNQFLHMSPTGALGELPTPRQRHVSSHEEWMETQPLRWHGFSQLKTVEMCLGWEEEWEQHGILVGECREWLDMSLVWEVADMRDEDAEVVGSILAGESVEGIRRDVKAIKVEGDEVREWLKGKVLEEKGAVMDGRCREIVGGVWSMVGGEK